MGRGDPQPERIIGRYAVFGEIAAGGMATVHLGRLSGPAGFARVVAIKRLHPQFARDPEFVSMFLDEARLAARIRHPNVVSSLDVVALEGELFIVMDYVEGESVSRLRRAAVDRGARLPAPLSAAILVNALHGLHAAHETRSETGAPLELVHRDVSPQNVLVGVDGVARVVDFGVAKAAGRLQATREGVVKGKIAYMAPEQLRRGPVDRRADIHAASVVFWELLTGQRLFVGDNEFQVAEQIIREGMRTPPSALDPELPAALDEIVMRGAARNPDERFATALEMADAIEAAVPIASPRMVGRLVEAYAATELERRAREISKMEGASVSSPSMQAFSTEETHLSDISAPGGTALGIVGAAVQTDPGGATRFTRTAPTQHTVPIDRLAVAALSRRPVPVAATPASSTARRRIGIGVGAALVSAAIVAVVGFAWSRRQPEIEQDVIAIPSPAPAASVTRPIAPATVEPEPEAQPKPQSEPPSAAPPASRKQARRQPPVAAKPSAPDPCDPPYYFEGKLKKFKPGCPL